MERMKLFREFAEECGCLTGPYSFASDHSRFRYFRTANLAPTSEIYDASPCTATLMCGLPAAGKDSWVKENAGEQPVISLDELRNDLEIDPTGEQGPVIHAAKDQAKVFLREGRSFIWNATNTTRMLRSGLVDLFWAYGAKVRMVYCEAPLAEISRRNAKRKRPVPEHIIERLFDHLDIPDLTEAQEIEWAVS